MAAPGVLLCYDETDKTLASEIARGLGTDGIIPFDFPDAGIHALGRWVQQILYVVVLVGDRLYPWQHRKTREALEYFAELQRELIPVLLPGATAPSVVPGFLRDLTWVDFNDSYGDSMQQLILRVRCVTGNKLSGIVSRLPDEPNSGLVWDPQTNMLTPFTEPVELTFDPDTGTLIPATDTTHVTADASYPAKSVFLCYRRDDAQDAAGRLRDRLVEAFGSERVFMDIDSVPIGIDFVDHVIEQIGKCSAVIVMIGKQWQSIRDKKRRRRLEIEDDLVRAEIRAALQQKIPVIPVTVQNASMPSADDLPEDIRALTRRNGIELSATRWKTDVERLIKELDRVMGRHA